MEKRNGKQVGGMKRILIFAGAVLILSGIIYANTELSKKNGALNESDLTNDAENAQTGMEITLLGAERSSNLGYFESFRKDREEVRDLEMQYLDEIMQASAMDAETLEQAKEQKFNIIANMEQEFAIETQVRAKGFSDAAAIINGDSVNVIVEDENLDEQEVAKILEIVQRIMGVSADRVKISSAAQSN